MLRLSRDSFRFTSRFVRGWLLQFSALLVVSCQCWASGSGGPDLLTGELGISVMDFKFTEFDTEGNRLNREQGTLPGLVAGLSTRQEKNFWDARIVYFADDVQHDGQTQSGSPVSTRTDQALMDGRFRVGQVFSVKERFSYRLYGGVGYRHWERNIRSIPGVTGLLEDYDWWYALAGVGGSYQTGQRSQWAIDLQLTRPLNARLKVDLTSDFDKKELDLRERTGARLSLDWTYALTKLRSIRSTVYAEWWDLDRSDTEPLFRNRVYAGTIAEPESETRSVGVSFSLVWN